MDLYGKLTLGQLTEQLQEYVKKFGNGLGIDDKEDKGARVHPYGPINTFGEFGDIHQIINAMKLRCDLLKSSGNIATSVIKVSQDSHQQDEIANPLKSCLKNTIERLRNATPDLTLKAVLQKLQAISEETGLKFDHGGQTGTDCFISSDMFYFEVKLDGFGDIIDVREQLHSGEPKSSAELADILRNRNYAEFKKRLKGLADLYRIKVDTFMKSSKIFAALEAVELDILKLSRGREMVSDIFEMINKGPMGYIFERQGGQLMQMTYFANPVDIINKEQDKTEEIQRKFGLSMEIAVESARTYRLPTSSLVRVDELNRISYENLDSNNSDELPASLVMRLSKPFAISENSLNEIHTIITHSAADQFVHASEAYLDNLILKQALDMKSRSEWHRQPFLVELPEEDHIYRISHCKTSENIGFMIARLPFQHTSQVQSIIKVLRKQAIYNTLLLSCTGEKNGSPSKEKSEYFDVRATNGSTINVTLEHPLHASLCSRRDTYGKVAAKYELKRVQPFFDANQILQWIEVISTGAMTPVNFTLCPDSTINTDLITAPDAPIFCTQAYMDKVINRCLSIPVTMRCILRKAANYVPDASEKVPLESTMDEVPRPKQLKLLMPPFSLDNSGSIPLVSPGVYTFSSNAETSSGPSFQFPTNDLTATLPGGYTKPAFSSPKKAKEQLGKANTPGTPKSRTFKLPKITLKRKRDGDEYEIDKEKSNFDVLEESDAQAIASSLADDAKQASNQQEATSKPSEIQAMTENVAVQEIPSRDIAFTTNNMPFDLSVDGLSGNAISINSVGELEGLLGPSIDVSSLMGGGLVTQLGIAGSTFPDGFEGITASEGSGVESQVEAFDLNAISAGSNITFGVDDSLSGVSNATIDPSMVVSSTASLSSAPVYDVQQSLFDIDSFMMSAEEGSKSSTGQSAIGND